MKIKIFPKVHTDYSVYQELTGSDYPVSKYTKGLYKEGRVWLGKMDPITLLHEFNHHVLWSVGGLRSASRRLFFDLIDVIMDGFYHWLRYPNKREKQEWGIIGDVIRDSWNDWLDWIFCREVD